MDKFMSAKSANEIAQYNSHTKEAIILRSFLDSIYNEALNGSFETTVTYYDFINVDIDKLLNTLEKHGYSVILSKNSFIATDGTHIEYKFKIKW